MEPRSSFNGQKEVRKNLVARNILIFLVAFFFVLLTLANYGIISDLVGDLSYVVFPGKKTADFEKLTAELMSLYSSVPVDYYQEEGGFRIDRSSGNVYQAHVQDDRNSTAANQSGNNIYIPDMGANAPIIAGTSTDADTILRQLKQGVLMYPGSSFPGNGGMTVIIGHSSSSIPWQKYGRIFSALPDMSEGDMIIISYNGKKYEYRVNKKIIGSVAQLASMNIQSDLVLGTCWPIGTDEKRILILASLVG